MICSEYQEQSCFRYVVLFLQFIQYPSRMILEHEIYGTNTEEGTVRQELTDLLFSGLIFDYSNTEISTERISK